MRLVRRHAKEMNQSKGKSDTMRDSLKILLISLLILVVDGKADAARTNGRAERNRKGDRLLFWYFSRAAAGCQA